MFQFPRFPRAELCVHSAVRRHAPARVSPFGDLRILAAAHASPELFVVYHVLHRHATPRHSPYALVAFPQNMCCEDLFSLALHILTSSCLLNYALGKEPLVSITSHHRRRKRPDNSSGRERATPSTVVFTLLSFATPISSSIPYSSPVMCRIS